MLISEIEQDQRAVSDGIGLGGYLSLEITELKAGKTVGQSENILYKRKIKCKHSES